MINMALRTGVTQAKPGEISRSFRDVIQMERKQTEAALQAKPAMRQRAMETLAESSLQFAFLWRWRRFLTFECAVTKGRTCIVWRGSATEVFRGVVIWQDNLPAC